MSQWLDKASDNTRSRPALAAYPNPYGLPVTEIRDLAAQAGVKPGEYWVTHIDDAFTEGQTLERKIAE